MKTKTYPHVVRKVTRTIGHGITHHKPTPENTLGQSGLHTLIDDVISLCLNAYTEAEAYKKLHEYFCEGVAEYE